MTEIALRPSAPARPGALTGLRVVETGFAAAGPLVGKYLANFGAEVIRVEDPTNQGRWDTMRAVGPYVDERRGVDLGGGFNNHNVNKFGVTVNLKTDDGRALLTRLLRVCDVVTENFAAGVLERLGFGYERLKEIRLELAYIPSPYREEMVSFTVSIGAAGTVRP